jgi:hypothetical protein
MVIFTREYRDRVMRSIQAYVESHSLSDEERLRLIDTHPVIGRFPFPCGLYHQELIDPSATSSVPSKPNDPSEGIRKISTA